MLKKNCNVVMIQSQKFSENAIVREVLSGNYYVALRANYGNKLFDAGIQYSQYDNMLTAYDLYILSDDPIGKGYFITPENRLYSANEFEPMEGDKKVIGTTNKESIKNGVNAIRVSFTNIYVDSLNSKDVITSVDVQYAEGNVPWVRTDGTIVTYKKVEKSLPISKVKEVAHDAWIESFFLKRNTDITGFDDWFSKYFNL